MKLTVLGCDGSYPGPGGAGSGYLIQHEQTSVWLDCGPGTLANLQRHIPLEHLDAVVVTHEHVDHWSDLEHLAVAVKYVLDRPALPVYCQADIASLMRSGAAGSLEIRHVGEASRVQLGAMVLTFSATAHSVPTLAVRVEAGGRSLGYSADTGPGWELAALGPDLDLALCEASYLSSGEGRGLAHLSARQAGETARRAGAGRLVITHLWPVVDPAEAASEASAAYGAPVEVAAIGKEFEV